MSKRGKPTTSPRIGTSTFRPPYPPSWFDRLTARVDRLPGPPWGFYAILAVGLALSISAVQWREGAYSAGTFNPGHVWIGVSLAYLLGLMHYLDRAASSAIASFRPLLSSTDTASRAAVQEQSTFDTLSYQLATLPPRPALLATIAGAAVASIWFAIDVASGTIPPYLAGTAGTALSTASIMIVFIPGNGLAGLLVYHTIHQLVHVSRIYTKHARIDIYHLQPLYALSLPGAFTALGLIAFVYVLSAITPTTAAANPVVIGLSLVFAVIAGATFALPLLGAHRRLVAEKKVSLAEVSSRFKATTVELHRQLDRGRLVQMDHLNKALASLQIEQDLLHKIPTWPWEPGAVRAVVGALLLPLAVWAIELVLARLLGV